LSAESGENAGNLKVCGDEVEPFRLETGGPDMFIVLGAIVTPVCRLAGRSRCVVSLVSDEKEEVRGEGWVVDRWLRGAVEVNLVFYEYNR
jgi:hypothetical protein